MYLAITVPETLGGAVRKEPGDPNTARLFLPPAKPSGAARGRKVKHDKDLAAVRVPS